MIVCSGQPMLMEHEKHWKDVVYTAICADGSCLPPVIITADPRLPDLDWKNATVILLPGSKGESNCSTLAWFDAVKDYLEDSPLLLMDNHLSHHSTTFTEETNDFGISQCYFPPKLGCLLSPLDNSFHAGLWRHYNSCKRDTHEDMVQAIIDSYYSVSEANIKHYWTHTGITSKTPAAHVAYQLLSEGYGFGEQQERREMTHAYQNWRYHWALLHNKARKLSESMEMLKGNMEGARWIPELVD